jgi:hypothetical protein
MKRMHRLGTAIVLAGMIAGGMMLGTARVEAKKGGVSPHDAICQYLADVINYPYVSPAIKSYALSLFYAIDPPCDPSLLN